MRKTLFVSISALLLISACTGESDRPVATGEAVVRAINTIPTAPEYSFSIEERFISDVAYSNVSNQGTYDDLDYTFNFAANLPGQVGSQRVASTFVEVEKDNEYTFVITGDVAAPTIIIWDGVIREFTGNETVTQARFAHTAESVGPIDVYFAAPGVPPAAGAAVATLAFGELSPPMDREAGDYVYILTTAGDAGDVLFESDTITTNAQSGFIIAPFDGTPNDLGPLAVRILPDAGGVSSLIDVNLTPTVRFIQASIALATADIYTDDMLTDRILANHAYRDVSADLVLDAGNYTFTYTPAGNTGSVLLEVSGSVFSSAHTQIYVVGETGALTSFARIPDRRPDDTSTKFTFTHAAFSHPAVDLYIVEAGTPLDDALLPFFFSLMPGSLPLTTRIEQGDLELYLTVSGEKTIIAGPVAITTTLGDVLEFISYDKVDPATADLVEIPLP